MPARRRTAEPDKPARLAPFDDEELELLRDAVETLQVRALQSKVKMRLRDEIGAEIQRRRAGGG